MDYSCPDCGQKLTGVPLGLGGDTSESFRCYRCGGFWLNSWLVNRIKSSMLDNWPGAKAEHTWIGLGTDACPKDGKQLQQFKGESVPPDLVIKRCSECNWYWFPGNTLFEYKPAQEAKANYFKAWGLTADVRSLLLPVASIVMLLASTTLGVQYILHNQVRVSTSASSEIRAVNIAYIGSGEAIISFSSRQRVDSLSYKRLTDTEWRTQSVDLENGLHLSKITDLAEGEIYVIRILDKEFDLRAW